MPAYLSAGSVQYNRARRINLRDPISQLGYYLPEDVHHESSTTITSDSSLSPYSGRRQRASRGLATRWPSHQVGPSESMRDSSSSTGSSSLYTSTMSKLLSHRRKRNTSRQLGGSNLDIDSPWSSTASSLFDGPNSGKVRRRRFNGNDNKQEANKQATDAGSPLNSNQGTIVELTQSEHFGRPAHQIGLQNSNMMVDNPEMRHQQQERGYRLKVQNSNGSLDVANVGDLQRGSFAKSRQASLVGRVNFNHVKRRNNMNRLNRRMLLSDTIDGHLVSSYKLSDLFSQSEIPGFREIFASDSYLRKFCWIVAFFFMTVLSLNDMTELITEYYDYPITVDLRLRDSSRLPFPAVTVCNLNVVRFSALCSSTSSLRLTNQIPSELRDKLCGIQVEKNNSGNGTGNSDDINDINDINNIGIVTTTSTAATTTTATASSGDISTANSTSSSPPTTSAPGITNNTTPVSVQTGAATSRRPWDDPLANRSHSGPPPSQLAGDSAAPGGPAEHKLIPQQSDGSATTRATLTSTQRRSTAKGALDLGDFADPATMLLMDRQSRPVGPHRGRRSIRLGESRPGVEPARPFAPQRQKIRIRTPPVATSHLSPPSMQDNSNGNDNDNDDDDDEDQDHEGHYKQRQPQYQFKQPTVLSQANKQGINMPSVGNNRVGGGGQRGGPNMANTATNTPPPMGPSTAAPFSSTTFSPPALPEDFELTERQERELQENLTNWLAVMNNRDPQLTWSLGHQFDDMILRCTMKSINCTHQRSFENSFSPTEGNCYTYRSKIRKRSSKSSPGASSGSSTGALPGAGGAYSRASGAGQAVFEDANLAGTNHGLELVLNLEKNEYISGSSQVGALVMIHHPSDLGYAASEATFVAPEFTTYIGLQMVNITRLPAPYPEYCVDTWPAKFADTLTRNSTYSQQACLRICLQKTIQTHCQCQSAFLPILELDGAGSSSPSSGRSAPGGQTTKAPDSVPDQASQPLVAQASPAINTQSGGSGEPRTIICDTRKLATRQCVREVMFRAADRVHNCECPPKCQVVRYDKTISMARWPTREDKVSFDRGKLEVNFQNLAKVIVYFQTMTCEEVSQQAVFNAAKLFSALGGIMGMYVGFSFLSVFEIFEVMSRKMWHHFTYKLRHLRPSNTNLAGNARS